MPQVTSLTGKKKKIGRKVGSFLGAVLKSFVQFRLNLSAADDPEQTH